MPERNKDIPVVILCGGFGTRLSEHTSVIPKPMVEIGGRPMLWHIMKYYSHFGFHEFILALGYKGDYIKRYFMDFYCLCQDLTVTLEDGKVSTHDYHCVEPWKVHLVDTGMESLTGERLKRLAPVINNRRFMMTYGDGVADINLDELLSRHEEMKGLVTITAVQPPARFGALQIAGDQVVGFKEKTTLKESWINGGFFVIEPKALDYIHGNVMWEHDPLETLAREGKLSAYRHYTFWQCMDTLRDVKYLESLCENGAPPWQIWR